MDARPASGAARTRAPREPRRTLDHRLQRVSPMTPKRHVELAIARDAARDPIARREFMTLMGAALGLAGLGGCTRAPTEEIVPYAVQPPEVTPGRPHFYATAMTLDGYATGVLV